MKKSKAVAFWRQTFLLMIRIQFKFKLKSVIVKEINLEKNELKQNLFAARCALLTKDTDDVHSDSH